MRNAGLHQKLMNSSLKNRVMKVLPQSMVSKVKQLYYKSEKSVLSEQDRQEVMHLYRDDIIQTQALLDIDLSNWINK